MAPDLNRPGLSSRVGLHLVTSHVVIGSRERTPRTSRRLEQFSRCIGIGRISIQPSVVVTEPPEGERGKVDSTQGIEAETPAGSFLGRAPQHQRRVDGRGPRGRFGVRNIERRPRYCRGSRREPQRNLDNLIFRGGERDCPVEDIAGGECVRYGVGVRRPDLAFR